MGRRRSRYSNAPDPGEPGRLEVEVGTPWAAVASLWPGGRRCRGRPRSGRTDRRRWWGRASHPKRPHSRTWWSSRVRRGGRANSGVPQPAARMMINEPEHAWVLLRRGVCWCRGGVVRHNRSDECGSTARFAPLQAPAQPQAHRPSLAPTLGDRVSLASLYERIHQVFCLETDAETVGK